MKKAVSIILTVSVIMSVLFSVNISAVNEPTVSISDLTYTIYDTYCSLTGCDTSASGEIVIPSSVSYNGKSYPVQKIGLRAFYDCSGITGLTIPASVQSIDDSAFYNCSRLKSVNISDIPAWCGITQVIGLTNDDAVSKQFRPFKEIVERLNRTFKASYRQTCGYDNFDGANYSVALWVAYYNFLRPHSRFRYKPLVRFEPLEGAALMQDKWLLLIYYGQKTCAILAN